MFQDGQMYTIQPIARTHPYWQDIQEAVNRRTKPGHGPITLVELFDVRWRFKPFPWSYSREFKPNRRWFYHGTSIANIQSILNNGFAVCQPHAASHGRMLGDGVYATYHANKGKSYAPDNYVISVMIYAPNTYLVNPNQSLDLSQVTGLSSTYDALEVRTDSIIGSHQMINHEICVYNPLRVIPRFILKLV